MKTAVVSICTALGMASALAAVRTWPQPKEMARSADYALTAGGQAVDVLATAKPQNNLAEKDRQPYSFAMFESDGPVAVDVARLGDKVAWRDVRVLPERLGVKPAVADGRAKFTLPGPCTAVFEPDGRHRALVIVVQPPEKDAPKDGDKGVVYVGPGLHRRPLTEVTSGQTLYLAPGAVLEGGVRASGEGVTVRGRGIVSGQPWPHEQGPKAADGRTVAHLLDGAGRNLVVRDVAFLSSWGWTVVLDGATNAVVDNVKVLGGRVINDDGIDICRSRNVTVRNSFVRSQDDCIAAKWWCDCVAVTNCTLWTDFANVVRVGYESDPSPKAFTGFRMADCDILHLTLEPRPVTDYWCNAALCVQASNNERMYDLFFENLRFHEISGKDALLVAKTFAVTQGCSYPTAGFIDGLILRDIALPSKDGARPAVYAETADAEHKIRNLHLVNVTGADKVRRVCVAKPAARTLHLVGDSTLEYRTPGSRAASWGEVLRGRLAEGVGLENHAVSGQSTRSFRPDWEQDVLPRLKKGDVLLLELGHNEPWGWSEDYLRRGEVPRNCSPAETQKNLVRYIKEAQAKGVEVILMTMTPKSFRSTGVVPTLNAIRATAKETGVPLFDMTELAGPKIWGQGSQEAASHYAGDNIHPGAKGAKLCADVFCAEVAAGKLPVLKGFLRP